MHLALLCPDFTGHLNPLLTLGRALARRGHRLTLLSQPSAQGKADAAGIPLVPFGRPDEHAHLATLQQRQAELLGFAALRQTSRWFDALSVPLLRDVPGLLERGGYDGVLMDQITLTTPILDASGLPYGIVCDALALHYDPLVPPPMTDWPVWTGWLGRLRNRLLHWVTVRSIAPLTQRVNVFCKSRGLPPWRLDDLFTAGLIQVAQQPAFFDFPRAQLPDHFHYSSPWHRAGRDAVPFPYDRLDGRPIVYASLGTVQNRVGWLFSAIARACHGLDVQLVLSLGGSTSVKIEGPFPPGAILLPYVPQLDLLRRATALITHAGMNTALEGLAAGLPMVALPLTNDQPAIARRLVALGVAELVPFWHARPTRLHDALQGVLRRPRYRLAAQACQVKLQTCPTVDDVAGWVEVALSRRQRLTRSAVAERGAVPQVVGKP